MKNYELKSPVPIKFAYLPEWEIVRESKFVREFDEQITFSRVELICRFQEIIAGEITIVVQEQSPNVIAAGLVNNFVGNLKKRKIRVNGSILLPIKPPNDFLSAWQFRTEAKSDDCLFTVIVVVLQTQTAFVLLGLISPTKDKSIQWWHYNYNSFLFTLNSFKISEKELQTFSLDFAT